MASGPRLKQIQADGAAPGDVATFSGSGWSPTPPAAAGSDYSNLPGAVSVLDAVYLSGTDTVARADADDPGKAPAIGFVVAVLSPTSCRVRNFGDLAGFAPPLTPGALYYVSTTPGGITSTAPDASGTVTQRVGRARNATTLSVDLDEHYVNP